MEKPMSINKAYIKYLATLTEEQLLKSLENVSREDKDEMNKIYHELMISGELTLQELNEDLKD